MQLSLREIIDATGGHLIKGDPSRLVERVCIDTRILQPGDAYVAIRGRNFDGEDFVPSALHAGAAGALCAGEVTLDDTPADAFLVAVPDTTVALGDIARAWRRKVAPRVLALTGSSGKTTTKEMIAHVCRGALPVLATEGNRNNHIGLPLTLVRLRPEHTIAIIEMGMNHSGELTYLAGVAEPTVGLVTNIGDAHLGNFSGIEGLIAAKMELVAALPAGATAILNADCPNVARGRRGLNPAVNVVTFGTSPGATVEARAIKACKPFGYQFQLRAQDESLPVYLPVFGRYQVMNAVAAVAAALELGIPLEVVAQRIQTFQTPEMRSAIAMIDGVQVIEDCYNASPSATVAAIQSFSELANANRRVLLLGEMFELGAFAEEGHRRVGRVAAASASDLVVCVGDQANWIADELIAHGAPVCHVNVVEDAVEVLRTWLRPGDAILVKGSRAARLERAVEQLRSARLAEHATIVEGDAV